MSIIRELSKKIPDNIRSELIITEEDPILNASPNSENKNMKLLSDIWYEFIAPHDTKSECPICLNTILTNFRQMKEELIELEKEYRKLKIISFENSKHIK